MVNISECDKEPIHMPGAIQQFGFLLVLNKHTMQVEQVSENISSFIDISPDEVLGKLFSGLLKEKYYVDGVFDISDSRESIFVLKLEHKTKGYCSNFEFSTHHHPDYLIVEAIQVFEDLRFHSVNGKLSMAIDRIEKTSSLAELYNTVVEEIQMITSFDRVMIYRFDDEWFGTVIAEKLSGPTVDSYFNHHFPASDIPAQARQMLAENVLRIIPDVSYRPSSLYPVLNPRTGEPTDIGRSLLRSPSPIHIEYLKNMKVGASLTVRILKEGRLWGLIACQHETAKRVTQSERFCSQTIGRIVSSLITSKENVEDYQFAVKIDSTLEKVVQNLKLTSNLIDVLVHQNPSIAILNQVVGSSLAIHNNNEWAIIGSTPEKNDLIELSRWVKANFNKDEIYVTDSLLKVYPSASNFSKEAAGAVIINLPHGKDNFIMFFRPAQISTIMWAGEPKKYEEERGEQIILHPRKSFESWKEKVEDRCVPWKNPEVEAFKKLKRIIIEYKLLKQFREFQIMADSLEQFIWVSAADGTPIYYNKRWFEVTGLSEDTMMRGLYGSGVVHPDDAPRAREMWKRSLLEGTPLNYEMRFLNRHGQYVWTLCHAIPVKDEKGKTIKWYGSGVDIQEIKEIQSELQKALSTRDEFISMASHELKTPLTSLSLLLELSERNLNKSKNIAPYIQKSIHELKRLKYLIDDLLDVTKMNAGKIEFTIKEHNINEIIHLVLERFHNDPRLGNLKEKFENVSPVKINCDAFRVEQVVTNLISNALKYGGDGMINVEVQKNSQHVVVKVIDQGMGISSEDQGKLFSRFQRVGQNKGINGLGLGLYICKGIIEAHHGRIGLESELGKGSTFYFELPL